MNERGKSLKEKLLEAFLRHLLAHSEKVAEGAGQPGCQFCPTLKIDARRPRRGFMNPGMSPQRFLRTLARDVNRIRRWALVGGLWSVLRGFDGVLSRPVDPFFRCDICKMPDPKVRKIA